VVDPAGRIAVDVAVDHASVIDMEVESVIRLGRIVRMAAQCLLPRDDLALVLDDPLAFGQVLHREHAVAMDGGTPRLNSAGVGKWGFGRHRRSLLV
jgi:hypothetical protein